MTSPLPVTAVVGSPGSSIRLPRTPPERGKFAKTPATAHADGSGSRGATAGDVRNASGRSRVPGPEAAMADDDKPEPRRAANELTTEECAEIAAAAAKARWRTPAADTTDGSGGDLLEPLTGAERRLCERESELAAE